MATKIFTIRLPGPLYDACKRAAAKQGMELGEWIRWLAAQATGVSGDVKQGMASVKSKRKRSQMARHAAKVRWNGSDSD